MKQILPTPKNWQDFEDLCYKLWKDFWADPNAHKNGRMGQEQKGVDVFGMPYLANGYHGVQCKGKNKNYGSELLKMEIESEAQNAETFTPKLEAFVMASTSPRNANLQEYCRTINMEGKRSFKVDVWSWDDIEEEILCRQELMKEFYPNFEIEYLPQKITLTPFVTVDRIGAFLGRPNIRENVSYDCIRLLYFLVYELMDNAFVHGKAKECSLKVEDGCVEMVDNGSAFNPLNLMGCDGGGGTNTLSVFINALKDYIEIDYALIDSKNIFKINFKDDVLSKNITDSFEITINSRDNYLFGRSQAERLAIRDFSMIPIEKKRIIVNVATNWGLALSIADAYFGKAISLLKGEQRIIVYLSDFAGIYKDMLSQFAGQPIDFIMRN